VSRSALPRRQAGVTTKTLVDYRQALAWFEAEREALVMAVTLAATMVP